MREINFLRDISETTKYQQEFHFVLDRKEQQRRKT